MKKSFKKSILFMWFVLLGFIMPMQMSAYYIAGWGGDWNHREMGNNQYTYFAQTAGDYQFSQLSIIQSFYIPPLDILYLFDNKQTFST